MIADQRKINLLVTGGCGFIGSNFINYIFASDKYKIINFDAMYYCADEKNVNSDIRNNPNYTLVKRSVMLDSVIALLENNNYQQVYHP